MAQTWEWIEDCIWLACSWHKLKYDPSMFRQNGAMDDGFTVHGQSRFDCCWTVSSLSTNLGAYQVQGMVEMTMRILAV